MKKVALTVAVLALGLAACNKNADNNAAKKPTVENAASTDVNAATNDVDGERRRGAERRRQRRRNAAANAAMPTRPNAK